MSGETTNLLDLLKLLVAPGFGFLGVYIGLQYGLKQLREQKRLDFIERQIREFYSPLLGYQRAILGVCRTLAAEYGIMVGNKSLP